MPFILLIECIIFVNFFTWQNKEYNSFMQEKYDIQVNYGVSGAMQEALADAGHIGTDYTEWGELELDPEVALEAYVTIMLRNFGWSDDDKNRADFLQEHVPFFLVADYNGYYLLFKQEIPNESSNIIQATRGLQWTPKIPYAIMDGRGSVNPTYYWYNLGTQYYTTVKESGEINEINRLTDGDSFGSYNHARMIITNCITDACNQAMNLAMEGDMVYKFNFPTVSSKVAASNPIDRPTIITYLSPYYKTKEYLTSVFAIGGAQITNAYNVLLYTDGTGKKYYAYADTRAKVEDLMLVDNSIKLINIVSSPKEAAEMGYWFDVRTR